MELEVKHIHKTYGAMTVLEDVSFSLAKGQKVGLVGDNGSGKTTILKILAGIVEPDGGTLSFRKGISVGYMPQDTSLTTNETVRDYLCRVSGLNVFEKRSEYSAKTLAESERGNGRDFERRVNVALAGFGLSKVSSDRRISSLSSGQKSKIFMIGVLLSDPDILLLDEPTNNLDLPVLIWLENFLARSRAACIVVSHDRFFLDKVVQKIFEIDRQTRMLTITNGKYSDYLVRKKKEVERQRLEYKNQQEEIKRLTEAARAEKMEAIQGARFLGTDNDKKLRGFKRERASRSGRAAKAIEKRVEQMEIVEKPIERDVFRIDLRPTKPGGSREIVFENVVAGYIDSGFRLGPISIAISYGSRVVILGPNGSGKTTFLKVINGELDPFDGKVVVGNALIVGNLMQEHDNLPRQESLKSFLTKRAGITFQDAHALTARFGFKATEIDKKIIALSPGERARLLFALFSALSVNTLLLDEPTNHLDLEALDALEEAVARYQGTIVLVSHDRYFVEKFRATDTYVFSEGKFARQQSFEAYAAKAEREAKRLINIF